MEYRREIDGLRAIAVLAVIIFHINPNLIQGGYLGVDIFFVISGYLITAIILKEIKSNSFTIVNFYERRARRILPGLNVVLFASILAGILFLDPYNFKALSKSIIAVSTFSSNILFYLQIGYFTPEANEIPLLHTWSLAIEEQFYILYPILLLLIYRLNPKSLLTIIIFLAIISISYSQFLSKDSQSANFYLIGSRAWELLSGAIAAFIYNKTRHSSTNISQIISFLGLILIISSLSFFSDKTPSPGLYTLIPIIGTMLVLLFAQKNSFANHLLSMSPLTLTGKISYSLYLWHYPIFVFLNLKTIGHPTKTQYLIALLLLFPISYASWKYIETPFRNKKKFTRRTIFILSLTVTLIVSSIGLLGYLSQGLPGRFQQTALQATTLSSPKRESCHTEGSDYLPPEKSCTYFGKKIQWAILGDSHVTEIGFALAERLKSSNTGLLHLSFSDCPPALTFTTNLPGCTDWLRESVQYLENDKAIRHVFVGFRHSYHLYGNHSQSYPALPNLDPRRILAEKHDLNIEETEELYWSSFYELIDKLIASGKKVYILYPIPEIPMNINKAIHPISILNTDPLIDVDKATPLSYYHQRHKFILNKLDSITYHDHLIAIHPTEIYCDTDYCKAVMDNKALYFDDDHPSIAGARMLSELFVPYFETDEIQEKQLK